MFVTFRQNVPVENRVLRRFEITGYPTFLLLDANGEEIERFAGFGKTKSFIRQVEAAASDRRPLRAKIADFDKAPSAALAQRIAAALSLKDQQLDALAFYERALKLDPKLELRAERFQATAFAIGEGFLPWSALPLVADPMLAYARERHGLFDFGRTRKGTLRFVASVASYSFPEDGDRAALAPYVRPALETFKAKPRNEWERIQKQRFEEALAPAKALKQRVADAEAAGDTDAMETLAKDLCLNQEYTEAVALLRHVRELKPFKTVGVAPWLVPAVARAVSAGELAPEEFRKEADLYLAKSETGSEAPSLVAEWLPWAVRPGDDDAWAVARLDAGLAAAEKSEEKKQDAKELLAYRALFADKDPVKALALLRDSFGEGWEEDIEQVTTYGRFLWKQLRDLDQAETWARKATELPGSRYDKARAWRSLAEIEWAHEHRDAARTHLAEALKLTPRDKGLKRTIEKWNGTNA